MPSAHTNLLDNTLQGHPHPLPLSNATKVKVDQHAVGYAVRRPQSAVWVVPSCNKWKTHSETRSAASGPTSIDLERHGFMVLTSDYVYATTCAGHEHFIEVKACRGLQQTILIRILPYHPSPYFPSWRHPLTYCITNALVVAQTGYCVHAEDQLAILSGSRRHSQSPGIDACGHTRRSSSWR